MDAKLKHLEFIQSVIDRMSSASFVFKGWSITVASALLGFAVVKDKHALVVIAACTTILFWGLDAYYLWLERRFIALYTRVAKLPEDKIDFSMAIDKDHAFRSWLRTSVRPHLLLFYGIMLTVELLGIFIVRKG